MNVGIVKIDDGVDHASWANACQSALRSSMCVCVCLCLCEWVYVCVMIVCVPLVSVHVPQHSYAFIYFLSVIRGLEVLVVLCVRARVCVRMCV